MHDAKTHLSRLLERVAAGEEVVIGKAGVPVARLVPYRQPQRPRKPGALKGHIWMAPDFDQYDAEIARVFDQAVKRES